VIAVTWAAALVLLFFALLRIFGLVEHSRQVIALTRTSLGVIQNATLSDEEKEKKLQANSLQLIRWFLVLAIGGAVALLVPFGVLRLADYEGWVSLDKVVAVSFSPTFLAVSAAMALLALVPWHKPARAEDSPESSDYSSTDKIVHRLAFATREAQVAIAGVEDRLFRSRLADCPLERPVFITGLPRAGTTLLLEICAELPEFAAHRYRDMPFVLTPLLWDSISASFRQTRELKERTHGDGMLIGPESSEALEEIMWLAFDPTHYESDRIQPWGNHVDPELAMFLRSHMRKIIVLRRRAGSKRVRYVSKNNLNIARTNLLRRLFPDADIVVPFREPTQHAASLLSQHLNFLAIHQKDAFAKEYMREIGHFDFGDNLRPVDFNGWYGTRRAQDTRTIEFWIEYWVAAYRYLLDRGQRLYFIGYDSLCARPDSGLQSLATIIGCEGSPFAAARHRLRSPKATSVDLSSVSGSLLDRAYEIHRELEANAINGVPS
jgi:sulfotransferase family protein